ncbi:hypothetical protein GOV13_03250 [Candidatus Pacearchaeota archaeon]|nr:hypothetical protein [Candidatus Pacearchaeota archaeon]
MDKLESILVTVLGVLLTLPLLGVTALGDVSTGIASWVIALSVLVMGAKSLSGK